MRSLLLFTSRADSICLLETPISGWGTALDASANATVDGVLAITVTAARALLVGEWEESVSLATWAGRHLTDQAKTGVWGSHLESAGLRIEELQWVITILKARCALLKFTSCCCNFVSIDTWTSINSDNIPGTLSVPGNTTGGVRNIHSILCLWWRRSVYSRLLQRPNHSSRVGAEAHACELLTHLTAAQRLEPACLRPVFEQGWLSWKDQNYKRACQLFAQVRLASLCYH